jgi:hypothetical protein
LNIQGEVYEDRAGFSLPGDAESFVKYVDNLRRICKAVRFLGNGLTDFSYVHALKRILTELGSKSLAGNGDKWNAVYVTGV